MFLLLYFKNLITKFSCCFKIKTIVLSFLIILFFITTQTSFAQQTQSDIIISWQTSTFVPYNFKGKILPTIGSDVFVSVDLIQNKKLIDLSNTKIYWYVNNQLVSNVIGIQKIKFTAPPPNNSNIDLRVEFPDLGILKTIKIPVVKPQIIIDAPFPKKEIKTNYFELIAYPYFFNLKNNDLDYLNINWLINGQIKKPSIDDPFKIKINVIDETITNLEVEVFIQNTEIPNEKANKKVDLLFIK